MAGRGVLLQFLCVNALSGLSTAAVKQAIKAMANRCQCPKRADFISTNLAHGNIIVEICVNALSGLISFLQKWLKKKVVWH